MPLPPVMSPPSRPTSLRSECRQPSRRVASSPVSSRSRLSARPLLYPASGLFERRLRRHRNVREERGTDSDRRKQSAVGGAGHGQRFDTTEGRTMSRRFLVWVFSLLTLVTVGAAFADPKAATKIADELASVAAQHVTATSAGVIFRSSDPFLPASGDWVTIDAVAAGDPGSLAADLTGLGAQHVAVAGRVVSAHLPIRVIPQLETLATLRFAQPAYSATNAGRVTSQGDHAMRADTARATFGVTGAGVMVGVLSDSFNCRGGAATDVANGDLSPVTVLQEEPGCGSGTDEGRAMLQIVHDVAPGAGLAFATAFGGKAG